MKAIAKHDCSVALTLSLDTLSLNRMSIKQGDIIDFPVYLDKKLNKPISDILGKRSVTFQDGITLIPTYSKDFEYIE
jgi:hypothetical protein